MNGYIVKIVTFYDGKKIWNEKNIDFNNLYTDYLADDSLNQNIER